MPKRSRRSRRRVTLFSRFRRELRTLSLADRCLFFMFLVLLVQSAAVMFSPPPEAGGEIDIIVRISSASIFGYLLSGGLSGSAAGESALVIGSLADGGNDLLDSFDHIVDVLPVVDPGAGDPEAAHMVGEALGDEDLTAVQFPQNGTILFHVLIEPGDDDTAPTARVTMGDNSTADLFPAVHAVLTDLPDTLLDILDADLVDQTQGFTQGNGAGIVAGAADLILAGGVGEGPVIDSLGVYLFPVSTPAAFGHGGVQIAGIALLDLIQAVLVHIQHTGAMIGESDCILGQPYSSTATVVLPSRVRALPSALVQELFHAGPVFADWLLQYQARKVRLLLGQNMTLSFDRARQRVAKTLLYLCGQYGRQKEDGVWLTNQFTCSDVAGITNVSRVSVNLIFREWEEAGILTRAHGRCCIRDPEELRRLAEPD